MNTARQLVLEVDNLSKAFGGLRAVNDISLTVDRTEIVGLIGPNGAGKSVFINLICGVYTPSSGSIRLRGQEVSQLPSYRRARLGISRTYQNIRLLKRMTVLENALVAAKQYAVHPLRAAFARRSASEIDAAMALLDKVHLSAKANQPAGALAYGEARRLEIVRALMGEPRLLFLDEPAAGMNEQETEELTHTIRFCQDHVDAIVVVEHDMAFIQNLSDRLVVMDAGTKIAEGAPREVLASQRVIEAYLGVDDDE